ncbi:MAG: hypothetical protein DMF11_14250 [Verrucomicrobia bacterium]|nr:MAG: hypothetical protein DMF11_14250 [Verrucomicrobiota bacterium]
MGIEAMPRLRSLAWVLIFADATVLCLLNFFCLMFLFFPIGIGTLDMIPWFAEKRDVFLNVLVH